MRQYIEGQVVQYVPAQVEEYVSGQPGQLPLHIKASKQNFNKLKTLQLNREQELIIFMTSFVEIVVKFIQPLQMLSGHFFPTKR